ncbi:hypothetical protein VTP01DRAFT_5993 [Rhizomucor pusillus]|uniref:uncharacterized protein n=1 Tax=Rhizomucor pusillus TaxID=4840 RepID=UPI003742418F
MDRSVPDFAKGVYSALKESIMQGRRYRSAYAQMDLESESEDENGSAAISNSLFYSIQQDHTAGDESIPLTDSNAYSDRSQLMFDQDQEENDKDYADHFSDYEESPKPSAIYLEPSEAAAAEGPSPPVKQQSLSESLLPTAAAIPTAITGVRSQRKYRDLFFALLYASSLVIFLCIGTIIAIATTSSSIERYTRQTTFKTIKDSAGIISIMTTAAIVAGTVWIYILRAFTKPLVWGSMVFVPVMMLGMFLWVIIESRQRNFVDGGLTALSFIPLLVGLFYAKVVYSSRHRINKTISVIELACDVLRSNPSIILVSLLLVAAFVLFTVIWLVLFSRLWLIGHTENTAGSSIIWVVDDNVYGLAAYYIFVYMWTAAIFINMQRFALSAITAQWYFHRHEPAHFHKDKAWKTALLRASTTSLGTLAFGGLILSSVQCLQFLSRLAKKYIKSSWPILPVITAILVYLESLVSQINHYTISLSGITGESFCESAKSGTKIFRRNLLSGLLGDLLTKLILYVGAFVITLSSGFGTYIFATHSLQSTHGFVVAILAALVPMYISQFFSYTMMSIVDATFLCYAIDLDTGMVHMSAAHNVFSGFD